jgi:2,3-dimethylmalate lyase
MGFACVAHPTALTYAIATTACRVLNHLHEHGTTAGLESEMITFEEFNRLVGLPRLRAAEEKYASLPAR